MSTPVVYTDDPDAAWTFTVTAADGANLDWATPKVATGGGTYTLTATWLGTASPTRKIKVPLDTLAAGAHALYLQVPSANDFKLGVVHVRDRT